MVLPYEVANFLTMVACDVCKKDIVGYCPDGGGPTTRACLEFASCCQLPEADYEVIKSFSGLLNLVEECSSLH